MESLQTVVLEMSLTFNPKALVEWAKRKKGVCCDYPAHDTEHLDWMEPELTAQGILAHALLEAVTEITEHGSARTLSTGIPTEICERIDADYQEALTKLQRNQMMRDVARRHQS